MLEILLGTLNKPQGPPDIGPGPEELLYGDEVEGYYGEVDDADLIDGVTLASVVGLTTGTAINNTDKWLKFSLDGKILYVSKKPRRYNLTFNSIYAQRIAYGVNGPGVAPNASLSLNQGRAITIAGRTYKVRLLSNANVDPSPLGNGIVTAGTELSEYNRTINRVHGTNPAGVSNAGTWGSLNDTDLGIAAAGGNGTYCFGCTACTDGNSSRYRFTRRADGKLWRAVADTAASSNGWRPVLELV